LNAQDLIDSRYISQKRFVGLDTITTLSSGDGGVV